MTIDIDPKSTLPTDSTAGTLVGRVWRPDVGPSVVAIRHDGVFDISRAFATMRDLCESADPAAGVAAATGERPEVVATKPSCSVGGTGAERGLDNTPA